MGDGPEIPAIRAFSAHWTSQAVYVPSRTATRSSPRQIPQSLVPPRVAGRCGPAGGRLRSPAFILRQNQPPGSPLGAGKSLRYNLFSNSRHTSETRLSLACGYTDASPDPKRPHSGPQAVTRGFPALVGDSPHAGVLWPTPIPPAGGRNAHRSPPELVGG